MVEVILLDWTAFLADGVAEEVTLVHRRSGLEVILIVSKVMDLATGKINLVVNCEVTGVEGEESWRSSCKAQD